MNDALTAIWKLTDTRMHFRVLGDRLVCDAHGADYRRRVLAEAFAELVAAGFDPRVIDLCA